MTAPDHSNNKLSHEYYRHLCDDCCFSVAGLDGGGRIIYWNKAAQSLFGRGSEEMLGRSFWQIVSQAQQPGLKDAFEKTLKTNQAAELELELADPKDPARLLTASITLSPIFNDQNSLLGIAAWARDITERKRLQQKLVHAEKMASLGTLASGVAHHFNNIIASVATFVDFAQNSPNPQATQRALKMTAEAANRIAKITSSLLTFAEKDIREFDLADLTEIVMTFSHLVENPLAEKRIRLSLRLHAVPVYEVPGSRIHQILGNLLNNAEQAMPEGGEITLSLEHKGKDLVMTFSDTGDGIAPEVLPHIFDPFFTTRGVVSGGNTSSSGLGLAVVHGIVGELHGSIEVESKLHQGTTLIIRFPLDKKPS